MAVVKRKMQRNADGVTEWTGKWVCRWYENSRERQRTFEKKWQAEQHRAAVQGRIARGDFIDPDAGRITFGHYFAEWIERQHFSSYYDQAVRGSYRRYMAPAFELIPLCNIRQSALQDWEKSIGHLSALSQRNEYKMLRQILTAAVNDRLLATNPCTRLTTNLPRAEERPVLNVWGIAEVDAMIDALPGRWQAAAILAAGCGLRRGEVFGLGVSDINFLRREVHVRRQLKWVNGPTLDAPKRGKQRVVPIPEWVLRALAEHLATYPVSHHWDLVFTTTYGNPVTLPHFGQKIWHPALRRAGLPQVRSNGMHMLRHHYATAIIDAGMHPREVATLLGHTDPGFTLRVYTHQFARTAEKARSAIDGLRDPGADEMRTLRPSAEA